MSTISPRPQEDEDDDDMSTPTAGCLSIRIVGVSCCPPMIKSVSTDTAPKVELSREPLGESITAVKKIRREENCRVSNNLESLETQEERSDEIRNRDRKPPFRTFEAGSFDFREILESGVRK